MEKKYRMAALDIGTSSVRTFLAEYDGRAVEIQEKDRFYHESVPVLGHEYWDLLGVFKQVRNALLQRKKTFPLTALPWFLGDRYHSPGQGRRISLGGLCQRRAV